jgi:hypothetical protein
MLFILSILMFYFAYRFGYCAIFNRSEFLKSSKNYTDFYKQFFIFNWWIDFFQKYPDIEISFAVFFGIISFISGILIFFVAIHGPIDVYW